MPHDNLTNFLAYQNVLHFSAYFHNSYPPPPTWKTVGYIAYLLEGMALWLPIVLPSWKVKNYSLISASNDLSEESRGIMSRTVTIDLTLCGFAAGNQTLLSAIWKLHFYYLTLNKSENSWGKANDWASSQKHIERFRCASFARDYKASCYMKNKAG